MKPSVDIYLDDNYDRFDTNIEFYIDPNHTLSVSIDPSGDIAWAYLWGEHEDHGSGSLFKKEKQMKPSESELISAGEEINYQPNIVKDHAAQTNNKDEELVQLKIAVRSLLDDVNKRYPDKNPREWTCKHMQLLDDLIQNEKETIRVSFTFDIDVGSDLDQELEFLHATGKYSRIKRLVEDYIRVQLSNPDFLKDMKVDFSIHSRTREQIISSMCFTYRHDYGIVKNSPIGMTEEERKSLYNQMAQIFDNDIAPYVDLKCFSKTNESLLSVNQLQHLSKTSHPPEGFSADTEW